MEEPPVKLDSNVVSSSLGLERGAIVVSQAINQAEDELAEESGRFCIEDMQVTYPTMRPEIIKGLLRKGELCNLIAAAKEGKSHLVADLCQTMASGGTWLGFQTQKGKTLIIDNELHCESIAERNRVIYLARNWADGSNGTFPHKGMLEYAPIRGKLIDIDGLWPKILKKIPKGYFNLIVLDAFYKFYPLTGNFSENNNAQMTALYTKLDAYAHDLDTSFLLVHHPTKGDQGGKNVLDVGAGAGVITRATDTHLILRPNPHNGKIVIEFKARTFPTLPAKEATYTYPVFTVEREMSPEELEKTKPQSKDKKKEFQPQDLVALFKGKPMTREEIIFASESFVPKPPKTRVNSLIKLCVETKRIMMIKSGKDERFEKMPEIIPDIEDAEIEPDCEVLLPPGEDA